MYKNDGKLYVKTNKYCNVIFKIFYNKQLCEKQTKIKIHTKCFHYYVRRRIPSFNLFLLSMQMQNMVAALCEKYHAREFVLSSSNWFLLNMRMNNIVAASCEKFVAHKFVFVLIGIICQSGIIWQSSKMFHLESIYVDNIFLK